SRDRAASHRHARPRAGRLPRGRLPSDHAHRRARLGEAASPDARGSLPLRAALERPGVLGRVRHRHPHVPPPAAAPPPSPPPTRPLTPLATTAPRRPPAFRRYTRLHGPGHPFMRGFPSHPADAIRACRTLGPTNAPDCAQGAYHDYWISLGGGDDTTRPKDAATTPEQVCGGVEFVRPCWYRFFWERESGTHVRTEADMLRLCKGISGFQRAGCMAGASLMMSRELEPVDHATECGKLSGTDTLNCLRGVDVPLLVGNRFEERRLIMTCADLPLTTRWGCFSWFGRTLAVVTDGKFRYAGCSALGTVHERVTCVAGAKRMDEALRTFS